MQHLECLRLKQIIFIAQFGGVTGPSQASRFSMLFGIFWLILLHSPITDCPCMNLTVKQTRKEQSVFLISSQKSLFNGCLVIAWWWFFWLGSCVWENNAFAWILFEALNIAWVQWCLELRLNEWTHALFLEGDCRYAGLARKTRCDWK